MEIDAKIYKNGSGKNALFFVKNDFSLEDDLTINNTHNQSSVSVSTNKSVTIPDNTQSLEDVTDSKFGGVHSTTPISTSQKHRRFILKILVHQLVSIIWLMIVLARGNFISKEGT